MKNKIRLKQEIIVCCLCMIPFLIVGFVLSNIPMFTSVNKNVDSSSEIAEEITKEIEETDTEIDTEVTIIEEEENICASPIHNYTYDEIMLLACAVYSEAGSCSDERQMYVASVILNRVNSEYFPDTIYDVIYQTEPCVQYACVTNGMIDSTLDKYNGNCTDYEFQYLENTYQNVLYVLENGSLLPENVVFQAGFEQGSGTYKKIGNTYFCYQ